MTFPTFVLKNAVGRRVPAGTYSKITLIGCKDCVIDGADGVKLVPAPAAHNNEAVVRVTGSPGTRVRNLSFAGLPAPVSDGTGMVEGMAAGEGIHIDSSDDSTVSHNTITFFHQGITFGSSRNLTIGHNTVGKCRTSPIAGAARDGLKIVENTLLGGLAWRWGLTGGDHGDAIHVWDDTQLILDLDISSNTFSQVGGTPILGIFVQARGGRYLNARVCSNTITNSNGQGIVLMNLSGTADGNTLIWSRVPTYRGLTSKDAPRLDVKAGCCDLIVSRTTGPVSVAKGLINVVVRA